MNRTRSLLVDFAVPFSSGTAGLLRGLAIAAKEKWI
jgi:hypothetical protein